MTTLPASRDVAEAQEMAHAPDIGPPSDLENIRGIGPYFARALARIGVHRIDDLVAFSPESLAQALQQDGGIRVSADRIESLRWIEQARQRCATPDPPPAPPLPVSSATREVGHGETGGGETEVTLFFDHVTSADGQSLWNTRVYLGDSGEERSFTGSDTAPWVNWILERVGIVSHASPAASDGVLTLTSIDVREAPAPDSPYMHHMAVDAHFRLRAPEGAEWCAQRVAYRIELYLMGTLTAPSRCVSAECGQLMPGVAEYVSHHEFPVPPVGRYDLHTLVILLPPAGVLVQNLGPAIEVVPT
jgi:predicted flap endonuclease-1-like 5' DNA nuclease